MQNSPGNFLARVEYWFMCCLAFPLGSFHISEEGIYFYVRTYSAASSLLSFTAALLILLRRYTPLLQKDEQLFNHATAQLGSEREVCLRLRCEAIGYAGRRRLLQILHSPMCQTWTRPRGVWHMLGRTPRTAALGKRDVGKTQGSSPAANAG